MRTGGRLIDVSGMAAAGRKIETSGTIAVRFADSTAISVDGSVLDFFAPGSGGVVVGSDAQTGSITVAAPIDLPYSLTLQQASVGAGGISVEAPLGVGDHTLALLRKNHGAAIKAKVA